VLELRIIRPGRGGVAGVGFFNAEQPFVEACAEWNGGANVYAGLQPRPLRFFARAPNTIVPLPETVKDVHIEWLSAIAIDIDPVRAKDSAATDAELAVSLDAGELLARSVERDGFLQPVRHMSGNGCQLWFAVPPLAITAANCEDVTARRSRSG
jgi:hypothetical protein